MRSSASVHGRSIGLRKAALLPLAISLCAASVAHAVTQLTLSSDAPEIALKDTAGADVSLSKLQGHVVVVMFGELYHDKTRGACTQVEAVLRDPRLRDQDIVPLLVTAQEGNAEEFKLLAAKQVSSFRVLRDPARKAFGDYQVAVMPSVVVVDKAGHVVLSLAGMTPQFSDNVSDSLLYAVGKLSLEQYQQTLHPKAQPTSNQSDPAVKASRIASLAQQLARRGLDDMAADKFTEALQLDPRQAGAHLGFGMLQLKRGRLAEAEVQFKAVLEQEPKSLEARLGLAFVQTSRGGRELDLAEPAVREILATNPTLARGHYLLGLIAQQRKKPEDAALSFKKAAELLMDQTPQETTHE